jgi:hypothetical protein
MSHPSSCKDPDNCSLTYREHLLGIGLSCTAIPSRAVTRTPGLPNEPAIQTHIRERRWSRDIAAYRRLHAQGYRPRRMEGSALREQRGETEYDVTQRPVKIDYNDPK